jgi:uncharacterized OsmC-like protein
MDSAELRAVQEPLKDSHRQNPGDATAEQLQTLIRLTERYCVVYQTLANPPALTMAVGEAPGS